MDARLKRLIALLLGVLLIFSIAGVVGCSGSEDEAADTETTDTETDGEETTDDSMAEEGVGDAELEDGALDIAQAWFIGPGSDYDTGDVTFEVAAMVQSEDGSWWARVTATPNDTTMETEQVYVSLAEGMTLWTAIDSGTGIDPTTDDRFPEDVAAELAP